MMEQAHQYWMLMKRRQILKSHFQSSMNESSWEERAFAEDSAGHLGGCIWPPRSYSCSFCKREFRSAQALGGHMNVHRRDRARLKQSLCTHQNEVCQDQNDSPGPFKQFESHSHHFQADHCSLGGYDLDLNSLSSNVASSSFSSSRVSALTTQENLSYVHTCASPYYPASVIQEKQKVSPFVKNSRSDSLAARFLGIPSDSKPQAYPNEEVYTSLSHDAFVETDLFMGLNSAINQYPSTGFTTGGDATSCKRPKTAVSALSFLIKPCSNKEVIGACSHSSMEDIDLELRLGEPPKVK